MMNVLIADDHAIIRLGLKLMIAPEFAPVTIAEAATFDEVIQLVSQQLFDLLILDINLPGGNNIHMLSSVRLRQPTLKVLIFSALDEQLYALNFLQAGADGYLQKSTAAEEVNQAIRVILKDEKYMSPATQQQLLQSKSGDKQLQNAFMELSAREIDVMNLLTRGIPIVKIAEILHVHISTVSTYKARLFAKLEVNNISELLQKARPYHFPAC
ncbi:response regulator transcription factor [Chitinophaga nivalis]|uniref:Response regulator transcription factor n=1 Tax=Chitinophaga nivalis TaxID=2991709 RepID=A0ABT3IKD7_9BACT|nr:response regulator transcription factor [Chitinophaga nivalis]MCW3466039.1 response regulator transcription factor [Chitinophaga nivalis]MCW3484270.1 response regulator transcription factor [Chitinophaga nivalis]